MRKLGVVVVAVLAISGSTAGGFAGSLGSAAATAAAKSASDAGEEAMSAYKYCREEAAKQCNVNTAYCNSYTRSFVKSCMVRIGVAPDYITLLLDQ